MEDTKKSEVALREEKTLAFWRENETFQKSLDKDVPKGEYVFYDGPPFATGLPHYGHILGSAVKDTVARYQTMQGFRVERKWGWDCHGLPIENIVEKDLKISGKKEIEALGVDVFNEYAKSKVLDYVSHWKSTVERMGRWVDFDGSYKTMDNTFIESVWWAFGEINKKGLVYEGVRVLPYCPRCETPIANSEIAMDHSYKDITDISVYVKLELVDEPGTYLLAWTTTPWTLPGNTAAAVNEETDYIVVQDTKDGVVSKYILAKDLFPKLSDKFESPVIVEELKGAQLVGKSYIPPFNYFISNPNIPNHSNGWKVYAADYVTTESGTGIVHLAPAYGEEDMDLAKKNNIPFVRHVGHDGKFTEEVVDFVGQKAKPKEDHQAGDVLIIKKLAGSGHLFAKEKIIHSYPHCFRCETPLYYFALDAWFINIQKVKQRMLDLNQQIDWIPEHLKNGRFGNSMEGAPDWNISRNRYWASPLPIWKNKDGNETLFIDSVETLKKHTKRNNNTFIFIRHGEAESNAQNIATSDITTEFHLTEKGKKQIHELSEKLNVKNVTAVYASPFLRTQESARLIADALGFDAKRIVTDDRIREYNFGDFSGKPFVEYLKYEEDHMRSYSTVIPNGESYLDAKKRFGEFLYEVDAKHTGETVLVVTHGIGLEVISAIIEGADMERSKEIINTVVFNPSDFLEFDFTPLPHNKNFELDLHRPYIDDIVLMNAKGEEMYRIKEVFDCWFESGSMPFAQRHYPFENVEWFKNNFPSQFIAEYIAQTRTWFYYMHAVSVMLFDNIAFEHVVTTGTVLAEDGQKMSKSKENFPDPTLLFDKYGVDAVRFYMLSSPLMKSEDLNFSERGVDEVYKKNILRTQNVVAFYELYRDDAIPSVQSNNVLDLWILSRLDEMVNSVTAGMEKYMLDQAHAPIETFIEDLSTWYLRRSRDRLKGGNAGDKAEALSTFRTVLDVMSRTIAPFLPFLAEDIHRRINSYSKQESVHLLSWPKATQLSVAQEEVLSLMKEIRKMVSLGLEVRARAGVKVRQPLQTLTLKSLVLEGKKEYLELLADEVNVKQINFDENQSEDVVLDLVVTPELQREGDARELMRAIQEMRKEKDLSPSDVISLDLLLTPAGKETVKQFEQEIKDVCGVGDLTIGDMDPGANPWFTIQF